MHHKDTYLCLKQTPISHLCPAGGNTTAPACVSPREEPRREYETEQSTLRLEFFFFSSCFGAKIVFTDLSVFAFFLLCPYYFRVSIDRLETPLLKLLQIPSACALCATHRSHELVLGEYLSGKRAFSVPLSSFCFETRARVVVLDKT